MQKQVVVTGLGSVNPLGNNTTNTWNSLLQGKSGIAPITLFDASQFSTRFGGEVKGFDPIALFGAKKARRMDRFTQLATEAGRQAIEDAKLTTGNLDLTRVGTIIGSGLGGMTTFLQQTNILKTKGPRRVTPFLIPMVLPDTAAAELAINYGFKGPSMSITSACATGTNAIGEAFEMVVRGAADIIVAGGADSLIIPPIFAGFSIMKAFSTRNDNPQSACRPFDATRDGFVPSEGAAILILEELSHAINRKAPIYAEVIGYGSSVDAHSMVAPMSNGYGASLAITAAIRRAGIDSTQIDYLNAHGTGTQLNDVTETKAIKLSLGDHAYKIAISSTKSMTGHLLGGAGALEALICAKTLQTNTIAPTINYQTADPNCDLNYTPNIACQTEVNIAMSNSFGFGGHNATLIFKKYKQTT